LFESEYFTRAGTKTAFSFGEFTPAMADNSRCVDDDTAKEHAWYCANWGGTTHPVRQKQPNPWGLFDVHGNSIEWTLDAEPNTYVPATSLRDPRATAAHGEQRVLRNGAGGGELTVLRSAYSSDFGPTDSRGAGLGFRLVRSLTPAEASAWQKGK
jgi:formylglycine-generating enzyme required for sulfatase activity